jgi:hypothetical protein
VSCALPPSLSSLGSIRREEEEEEEEAEQLLEYICILY